MTGLRSIRTRWVAAVALALFASVGLAAGYEARASRLQARHFTRQASQLTHRVGEGPSDRIRFPGGGPYDVRFGYTRLPAVLQAVTERGYGIAAQVRVSERFAAAVDRGVSPIFHEKARAGLRILDRRGATMFDAPHPGRTYASFDSIPLAVWQTLLFIENRALLDPRFPHRNPSIDWSRTVTATGDWAFSRLGSGRSVPGASTLATQIEKFRHAPEGRTRSPREKLLQMEAAALRSYLGGANTETARRGIITDYLNSVPLAAIVGYGEVTGLGEGLWAWYGADGDEVNRLLASDSAALAPRAIAYRQVLSLMLALRRPSYLLLEADGRDELRKRTDRHLHLLAREGIISQGLRDAALAVELTPRSRAPDVPRVSFIERKGADAVRTELLGLTGVRTLYELDRFDLTVRTTLDLQIQQEVTGLLLRLTDPAFSSGLLRRGDPARVIYAVVLHERTTEGNLVRVQVDNVDSPLNMIEGSKLELGSTAKLRTLISYLEIVERLYLRHTGRPAFHLRAEPVGVGDRITAWTLSYLADNPGVSRARVLQAAMSRPYSASPGEHLSGPASEGFFTGGSLHTFHNVDTLHDRQALSVRDAFIHSVNLPFIRIMRDIVHYHADRLLGNRYEPPARPAAPDDRPQWPAAHATALEEVEGRAWIEHFYRQYQDEDSGAALDVLARGQPSAGLAWAFRSIAPDAGIGEFGKFLRGHDSREPLSDARIAELYDGSSPAEFSIADRGHLAGMHPLELWLWAYLRQHPGAPLLQIMDASAFVRWDVSGGQSSVPVATGRRIASLREAEAFRQIHQSWRRLGYPFETLVPSYATAIGSSADRPDQLAELVGILLNDGVYYPVRRIEELHFARGTPYETLVRPSIQAGDRVLSSEITAVVRAAMVAVVARGTARRGAGAVRTADGSALAIGAKTGTGNNRFRVIGRDGTVMKDRAIDRTATVVFFLGDRFYGTITAFVSGPTAGRYAFTSALPLQILTLLAPTLERLIAARQETVSP